MEIFKLHIPFLDDVKEKGAAQAVWDKTDDVVTRVTAGLNADAVRGVLRDDPVSRPNPRLQPHADGFWLHMKPTYYNNLMDGIYPTFRLGWLSVYFLFFETITGIYLMIWYTPSPLVAFENMWDILGNVPFGRLMRDMHRLGAELMVIVVALHMLRTLVTGSYKMPRQFTWFTGAALLWITLFLSFTGYLLPWDQLSLWAVTIGASMAEAAPPEIVGQTANLLLRGGPDIGANGLLRFYLLHVILLPFVAFLLLGVHYYKVILHGHSLPPRDEKIGEDTARKTPMDKRVYFLPTILTRELAYFSVLTLVLIVASAWLYHAPLEPHADAQITPLHTTAPWYFLWLQGMLKIGDKVIWGVVIPTIIVGLTLVFPYLEVGPSRRYGHRRVGLTVTAIIVAVLAIISFMGTPWYAVSSSPDQEAVAALLPQTHPGPVRLAPFDDLVPGTYVASESAIAPNETLMALLEEFDHEIEIAAHDRAGNYLLIDADGFLIIEDWQNDLRKITLRVVWTTPAGEPGEFSDTVYVHRDSAHEVTTKYGE